MGHPGPSFISDNVVIWITLWLIAALGWSVFAVVRHVVKLSHPLGIVRLVVAAGLIASGLFVADQAWPESDAPTVQVIDGDTLRIGNARIRLWGVDAPELQQLCRSQGQNYACGQRARAYLESLIRGKRVECRDLVHDRYGRSVSWCAIDGNDLAYEMVLAGWALDYRRYSDGHYAAPERRARILKRGMWAGTFFAPWDWRRR